MRAPPPDLTRAGGAILAIATFIFAAFLPLLLSAMVPNGLQRIGAAVFCVVGIGFLVGFAHAGSTPFSMGLGLGFCLASIKLLTGMRFL